MQSLVEFMDRDRLKKYKVDKHIYFPKTSHELVMIIRGLIEERGLEADLNDIDTSKITDMANLFNDSRFNVREFNGNISEWDVSNVESMTGMFAYTKFNGDIENWNVDPNCRMYGMFKSCPLEKHPPKWYRN